MVRDPPVVNRVGNVRKVAARVPCSRTVRPCPQHACVRVALPCAGVWGFAPLRQAAGAVARACRVSWGRAWSSLSSRRVRELERLAPWLL